MRSKSLCSKIGAIKDKMDDMTTSEEDVSQWIFLLKELAYIKRLDGTDAAQKSKIKWEVEGDENTTFFHGFLNQRRRKQMVQGIMDGQWHTDPETIKNVFIDFYREKFDAVQTHMSALDRIRFSQLDNYDIGMLERPCSIEEDDIYNMVTAFCNEGKLPIGWGPLSPFIFILSMECLHIAIQKAMKDKKIASAVVGDTKLNISYFFYAVDVVFLADWSHGEADEILDALNKFQWRITPFKYLAIPVGASMARTSRLDGVIQRFQNHLSKRKVKMLSIRGRLTLIKSVLWSLGIYLMSLFRVPEGVIKELEQLRARFFLGCQSNEKNIAWVAWDKVLASKDREGLEIGSLASFNLTLLHKWQWRFYNESEAIWCHVIKAIHGYHGGVKTSLYCKVRNRWKDGGWMWKWRRDVRGGIEQSQLNSLLILLANIGLQNGQDKAR
nr:RNA-directed DNA polymerase, eukaryota, reverse transcriptase zinc-binding domain protein [Tanacetum cinerariifolium]